MIFVLEDTSRFGGLPIVYWGHMFYISINCVWVFLYFLIVFRVSFIVGVYTHTTLLVNFQQTLHFILHTSLLYYSFKLKSVSYFPAFVWNFCIFIQYFFTCVSYFYGATGTFDKLWCNLTFHNRGGLQLTSRSSNRFYWIQIQLN